MEKLLQKAIAPLSLTPAFMYPTGPNKLSPRDIPGFLPEDASEEDAEQEIDSWAWFRKDDATGEYRYFDLGMEAVAKAISEAGGVDGVIGFSQGGAMAALVASALQHPQRPAPAEHESWIKSLREANSQKPLQFAINYSGFYAPWPALSWLYEPKVSTPNLHYIGSLDTIVSEERIYGLTERCEEPIVIVHPGGHYVPVAKEWVMPAIGFIRECVESKPVEEPML
jgi:hypothetical protein